MLGYIRVGGYSSLQNYPCNLAVGITQRVWHCLCVNVHCGSDVGMPQQFLLDSYIDTQLSKH